MAKQTLGEHWQRLFRGDSAGARCMQPPYMLAGTPHKDSISVDALRNHQCVQLSFSTFALQQES